MNNDAMTSGEIEPVRGRVRTSSNASRPWFVLAGVAFTLFATGLFWMFHILSSSAGETPDNFSAIQDGGIAVVSAPGGRTAMLHVHTSIKAICAVTYGTTAAYGRLATDRAMDPSGHQNHAAFLTGLTPHTRYLYRLQGVGTDGRLYRSPVYTFHTPAAVLQVDGHDMAIGATVLKVSSVFSPDFAAKYAVDGDPGTEWASQGDGNHAFITIALRHTVRVSAVAFLTRSMGDGTAITKTYSVTVDGKRTYGPFRASPGSAVNRVTFTGRVIRFSVVQSTGGNTGASEVAVYGRP